MQARANLPDKPDPNEMRRVSTKLKTRSKKKEKFPMTNIEHMQKQKGAVSYDANQASDAAHTRQVELGRDYCFEQQFYGCFVRMMQYYENHADLLLIGCYIPEKHEFNTMLTRDRDPQQVTPAEYKKYLQVYRYMQRHNVGFGAAEAALQANAQKRLGQRAAEFRADLNESARLMDDSVIF